MGRLATLRQVLDAPTSRYRELAPPARTYGEYTATKRHRDDEEILTEPILQDLVERVLGFPPDRYFPQYGKGGLKPDLTPVDLVAHRFVLDAKSSLQELSAHEAQIRRYIDQRQLDYGVLFNLREVRVYRRGRRGCERDLSFPLLPLWQVAREEAISGVEVERFIAFCERFQHHDVDMAGKIERIRGARSWAEREARGETVTIDQEFLVDRLRDLSRELVEDAEAQFGVLASSLAVNPGRERALRGELESIALDIEPGTDTSALPTKVEQFRLDDRLAGRAWKQYLLRVAQLALTRILLYRSWEDVDFVDDYLYDGGFGEVYERLDHNVRRVLNEAFARGRERYRWLYGEDNNYDWYRPRDDALVDILYALVPVPLGKLDADVLGGLYASYVDEIDRDRLGQFYTPRSVVRFMLDRAGFTGPEGLFQVEGDSRTGRRVFDFATGSGGFLVEAARRIVDEGGVAPDDPKGLTESLAAIASGFAGCEISPFPYYLTEINLLLQTSRLIGRMRQAAVDPPPFVLSIVHGDTLASRRAGDESLHGLAGGDRADRAELVADERYGIVPLDAEKQEAWRRIRDEGQFDLVVGNPPYVFESNNKVLFERLRSIPAWASVYRGKSDYLYYFLYLAAEKVAPGGRLCVVTPAGWMNAGAADWLREKLSETLRLDELFLFGSYRLFAPEPGRRGQTRAPTPTVESAILVATKVPAPSSHRLKVVALEEEQAAAVALSGNADARVPDRDALLEEMARRAAGRAGRSGGLRVQSVPQGDLVASRPWPVKHAPRDVAARAVAHLQRQLDAGDSQVERLGERWNIFQGVQTGADAYTKRIQRRLSPAARDRLAQAGLELGQPILELPPGAESEPPWSEHPELLARAPESRAILYGAIDDADYASLVWIGRDDPVPEAVVRVLDPWKPLLETRADFVANPERRWFETHRIRDRDALRSPKVIALYRTDRGRFALDETGDWQPSIKTTIVTAKDHELSVAYLCGLLNSELLDLWYAVRGKTPWHVRRNYEPKPMAEIPYRHMPSKPATTEYLNELDAAVAERDLHHLSAVISGLVDRFSETTEGDGEIASALERIVRAVARNRRAALPLRAILPGLTAIVKDPWRTDVPAVDVPAVVASLAPAARISVRVDPTLDAKVDTEGSLGRPGSARANWSSAGGGRPQRPFQVRLCASAS